MALQHKPQKDDDKLRVKFYTEQVLQGLQSEIADRPIFEPVEFISIGVPGDIGHEVCRKATDDDKERFLPLWNLFKQNQDQTIVGTSLDTWGHLTDSNKHLLRYLGFTNVEQIAGASDSQLAKIMDGFSLRTQAGAFLAAQKDSNAAQKYAQEAAESKKALDEMRARMEALESAQAKDTPRLGRPPKVENVANPA